MRLITVDFINSILHLFHQGELLLCIIHEIRDCSYRFLLFGIKRKKYIAFLEFFLIVIKFFLIFWFFIFTKNSLFYNNLLLKSLKQKLFINIILIIF